MLDEYTAQAWNLLEYCKRNYPQLLTLVPPYITKVKKARGNPPDRRPATVTMVVPDEVATRLKAEGNKDIILVCHIPEEVVDRLSSRIVLPGEEQN